MWTANLAAKQSLIADSVKSLVALDTTEAVYIAYHGSGTACVVTVATANELTFTVDGTVDANVGTAGVVDCTDAAYQTVGLLVDYFNTLDDYTAMAGAALRPQDTDGWLLLGSAVDAAVPGGMTIYVDSSTLSSGAPAWEGVLITKHTLQGGTDDNWQHALGNITMKVTNAGTAANCLLKIYSRNVLTATETLIAQFLYVTATQLILDTADWGNFAMAALPGEELLVLMTATGGTTTFTAMTEFRVLAKHVPVVGIRQPPGGQYASAR